MLNKLKVDNFNFKILPFWTSQILFCSFEKFLIYTKSLSDSWHWKYDLQNVLQPFKCSFSIFLTWGCSPLFNIEWKVECLTPKTPKAWVNSFWSLLFLPMASSTGAPSLSPMLLSPSSSSYLQAKRPENGIKSKQKILFCSRVPEINEWV